MIGQCEVKQTLAHDGQKFNFGDHSVELNSLIENLEMRKILTFYNGFQERKIFKNALLGEL